ncbi:MAG: ParB family transcriptional regulator, chromosome partitioning protein [Phycisphaerales bacterium]|jgi:ParB family chromosome partitioning protein|nr:ParB family transcriptional regulator, chromosome partitioning protein [Phycisphaerales bacterium]
MSKMQQKPKSRLGRGLSSLISVSELPVEAEVESPANTPPATTPPAPQQSGDAAPRPPVMRSVEPSNAPTTDTRPAEVPRGTDVNVNGTPLEISLADVSPNPHQPRRQFNDAGLAELAASLKSNGVIQPIVVRRVNDRYELVAGERRLRAAKLAGLATIPAIVRELDSFTQAQMALVENIHREDLNPIERAAAYRALIDQLGLTQAELANRLGEDRSTVANFLRLLELAEPVRTMIRDGKLSLGHAKVLAGVSDALEQERLANLVVSQELSVRNLERLVQSPTAPAPDRPAKGSASAHLQDLEKSFARQLGMRVQIRSGANKSKGRVVIHYGSLDQFDQLLEKLGINADQT